LGNYIQRNIWSAQTQKSFHFKKTLKNVSLDTAKRTETPTTWKEVKEDLKKEQNVKILPKTLLLFHPYAVLCTCYHLLYNYTNLPTIMVSALFLVKPYDKRTCCLPMYGLLTYYLTMQVPDAKTTDWQDCLDILFKSMYIVGN
jgi:hypothetical protein